MGLLDVAFDPLLAAHGSLVIERDDQYLARAFPVRVRPQGQIRLAPPNPSKAAYRLSLACSATPFTASRYSPSCALTPGCVTASTGWDSSCRLHHIGKLVPVALNDVICS